MAPKEGRGPRPPTRRLSPARDPRSRVSSVPRSPAEKPVTPVENSPSGEKKIVRAPDGTFLEGTNAGGRTKGSRTRVVQIRLEVEEAMRLKLQGAAARIIDKAIAMALEGNEAAMKVLLDKMLTSPKDQDDSDIKPNEVKVIIVGPADHDRPKLTILKPSDRPVIDVTPTKEKVPHG